MTMSLSLRSPSLAAHPVISDPARLRTLTESGLLEDAAPALDRFTRVLAQVTNAKIVTLSVVDDADERLVSSYGVPDPWFETGELSLDASLTKWIVSSGHPLIVEDARRDPLLAGSEPVLGWGIVSYAGHPVRVSGHTLGAVAVMDTSPRRWLGSELDLLREVAASVATEIRSREVKRSLAIKAAVLDAVLNVVAEEIVVYDASGHVLSSNHATPTLAPQARTLVPLTNEPRFSETRAGAPVPATQTPLSRALLGERSNQQWFVRDAEHPGGRWCQVAATPISDQRGRVVGAVVVTSGSRI